MIVQPVVEPMDRFAALILPMSPDATISSLASHCPALSSLSLSHCELVTDEGIRQLGASPAARER